MYINGYHINTLLMDLPTKVDAFVRLNTDGSYTIIVNNALNDVGQRKAWLHEYEHIINGDHTSEESVNTIESRM